MSSERATAPMPAHEGWMREALRAAREAESRDEVPIGACIVIDDQQVAIAGNRTRTDCDPTAHAEIIALREAAQIIGNYRLGDATVYSTIEPCAMCAGALIQARVPCLSMARVMKRRGRLIPTFRFATRIN